MSAFASSTHPRVEAWAEFRTLIDAVGASPKPDTTASESVHRSRVPSGLMLRGTAHTDDHTRALWRLIATNGREIGRGSHLYESGPSATAHVRDLALRTNDFVMTTVPGRHSGLFGWHLRLDDTIVMTCSRWYDGHRANQLSAAAASVALFRAEISDAPLRHDARLRHSTDDTHPAEPAGDLRPRRPGRLLHEATRYQH